MQTRKRISLNGLWDFSLPCGEPEKRMVPGSYPCVGDSVYQSCFTLDKLPIGRRLMLCFEGIAYEGRLTVNGEEVGEMLPYSFYSFDITSLTREGENTIRLYLKDLNAKFGPAEGWKSYSGIVRPVFLEECSASFISDVFFYCRFSQDYEDAFCTVEYTVDGASEGLDVCVSLLRENEIVSSVSVSAETGKAHFSVSSPALWSPDSPVLYKLVTTLKKGEDLLDCQTQAVGFKDFGIDSGKFTLNGRPIFLCGVCRHDLWTDEVAFTQTDEMIEKDLRMIKALGANYVRLVHYPHDRRVIEAADRIGLLVSEEPGLWWSDLNDQIITSSALSVLEKVIIRDRSHVSVAFWLSFNECIFTDKFLHDAAETTKRLDPTRLISGANCNDPVETKRIFDSNGFDFYTMHPYGTHPTHVNGGTLEDVCRVLSGKPVLFTEWGGFYVQNNPNLFEEFCRTMFSLWRNEAPKPTLAGMCFWEWQDVCEAQRGEPACFDGVLTEGLVTIDRQPKPLYTLFARMVKELYCPPEPKQGTIAVANAGAPNHLYVPVSIPATPDEVWEKAIKASVLMPGYYHKKERRIQNGPTLPHHLSRLGSLVVDIPKGRPSVIASQSEPVCISVEDTAKAVWFIGQCTMGEGYPISGKFGENIGCYRLYFSDGSVQTVPLANGLETATVFGLIGPTEFDPRAAHTSRAFSIAYDRNWEIYRTGLYRVALAGSAVLRSIEIAVSAKDYYLLLYGITLEK